jgi:hypothetical protein
MWIFFIALIVAGLLLATLTRRYIPKTYKVINAVAWTIEGLFWVLVVAAVIYWPVGGQPFYRNDIEPARMPNSGDADGWAYVYPAKARYRLEPAFLVLDATAVVLFSSWGFVLTLHVHFEPDRPPRE